MKKHIAAMALLGALASASGAGAAPGDVARLRRGVAARVAAGSDQALGSAAALTAKGVAATPDKKRIMVSKLVGDERWLVTWDDHVGKGDVAGIVLTGDRVIFLLCKITGATGPDPETDSLLLLCYSGEGVVASSSWSLLGDFKLAGSFFLP